MLARAFYSLVDLQSEVALLDKLLCGPSLSMLALYLLLASKDPKTPLIKRELDCTR